MISIEIILLLSALIVQKGLLKQHYKSGHIGIKIFECNTCDAIFTQKCQLKRHTEAVHEGKKPHECNMCNAMKFALNATFKQCIFLVRHEIVPDVCLI